MTKESVLSLLRDTEGFVSGERMSRTLNLSRTAVWKAVQALRDEGYVIESVTNRGYRLAAVPDKLSQSEIRRLLGDHPWAERVQVLEETSSTNTAAKDLAAHGAPEGTIVIAERQTGGKAAWDGASPLRRGWGCICRRCCGPRFRRCRCSI